MVSDMCPTTRQRSETDAAIELAEKDARIARLEKALATFAEFAIWTDESGWTSTIHKEPISVWFGPSDFREAKEAYDDTKLPT